MNQYIKIFLVAVIFVTAASCNRDEVFNREQYKNVFAIVSGDYNVHTVIHDYRLPLSTGYISASLGGTNLFDKNITITLAEDPSVLLNYNKMLYQDNRDRYVKALNPGQYSFDSGYSMTIPAGKVNASLPVTIKTAGLSPDSVRYIALRVDTYNAGELNMDKGTVLYEVRVKNWWCTYSGTNYVSRGLQYQGSLAPTNIYANKYLYPFGPATVRMMAGNEKDKDASGNPQYKDYAIMLKISDDTTQYTIAGAVKTGSPVSITPFGTLNVVAVTKGDPDYDPNYPNIAISADYDGYYFFKTLLLNYRYTNSIGNAVRVEEEVRLQYIIDPTDPRFLKN